MSLASDLMGLGVSPLLAARTATAGNGPVTITPVGASYASSAKIGATQFLISVTANTGLAVGLPVIGSDNGAFIGDDYVINNQSATTLSVRVSTSVLISMFGTISSVQTIIPHTTATFYPIQSTLASTTPNWVGVGGT